MSFGRRLSDFLGLRSNIAALLAAIIVLGIGEELWIRFVPKYLEDLGAGALVIGLYDALKTVLGAVYALPGGILADRWGHRRALVFFTLLSLAGYAVLFAIPHWGAVLGASFLFLSWSSFSLPATFSLIGKNLPSSKYGMGIAVQAIVKRAPILIGPVIGGALMDGAGMRRGMRICVGAAAVLGIGAIPIQRRISEEMPSGALVERGGWKLTLAGFRPELRHLLLSDILVRFCERIPFAWVVIYAMSQPGIGAKEFGYLTTVEMATVMITVLPVAYLSDRYGREPFVVATFVFFALFPFFLLRADNLSWLVAAFVIRGLKEFGEPARKALIIHFSSGPNQGRTVGTYYLVRDLSVTPGAFLGAWLWQRGAKVNFWGACFFGIAGTLYYLSVLLRARFSNPRRREKNGLVSKESDEDLY